MLAARIGGYVVAAHLRRQLSKDHEVTVVSSNRNSEELVHYVNERVPRPPSYADLTDWQFSFYFLGSNIDENFAKPFLC